MQVNVYRIYSFITEFQLVMDTWLLKFLIPWRDAWQFAIQYLFVRFQKAKALKMLIQAELEENWGQV